MKKLSRFLGLFLLFQICSSLAPACVNAADSGYDIASYNIDIDIGRDNIYHITETITADFYVPSRGIYRYIPLRQEMEWVSDGTVKRVVYNTRVSSISVQGVPFETYTDNGNMVIKIGDPNKYITGRSVYKISYDHALGKDKIDELDFIYYNLVGTRWDCNISGVTFSINMPEDFNQAGVAFFSGSLGSVEAPVEYDVSNNVISGKLGKNLRPGEGLTIQLDLPEGYFEAPAGFPWQTSFIVASIAAVLGSLILFLLYGRDRVLPKPVEFYPPDGITPAEAGYIIDTSVDDKDIVSLIIYWASKGALIIEQTGNDDLKLVKLNSLTSSANGYEKTFFEAIFKNRESVMLSELNETIYRELEAAKSQVSELYLSKENMLYSSLSNFLSKLVVILASALVWVTLFFTIYESLYSLESALVFSLAGTFVIMLPISSLKRVLTRWNSTERVKRSTMLVFSGIGAAVVLVVYIGFMYMQDLLLGGISVAAAIFSLGVISVYMRKRTRRGSELLGRILGFKNFLEVAEKERIDLLVQENPSYFYDVLPYAYVLGVSEKWAKKFEGIAMRPPDWYTGAYSGAFTPLIFHLLIFNSLTAMQSAMTARPVATRGGFGGGGFGGGGFAGGGFGGGGGGRW